MMKFLGSLALAFGLAGPAMAAERLITITGTGHVSVVPDMAQFDISVQSEGQTAAEALRENSSRMDKILGQLKAQGIGDKDIRTTRINVGPVWSDWAPKGEGANKREVTGYSASSSISLTLRNLNGIGQLLDGLVELGASGLSGPHFGVQDPRPSLDAARRAAVADARAQAELYADAAGVRLGRLVSIMPQGQGMGIFGKASPVMHMMETASAMPVAPGELDSRVDVIAQWAIETAEDGAKKSD